MLTISLDEKQKNKTVMQTTRRVLRIPDTYFPHVPDMYEGDGKHVPDIRFGYRMVFNQLQLIYKQPAQIINNLKQI